MGRSEHFLGGGATEAKQRGAREGGGWQSSPHCLGGRPGEEPHETLALRASSGPPPNSSGVSRCSSRGPCSRLPPEPCGFLWRPSLQVSRGDKKHAPPANPGSWDQPLPSPKPSPLEHGRTAGVRAKGRKREEAREREGKDRGRRQVIWSQTSGDIFREAGKQVLVGEHSSPCSWKAGTLSLILAQT